jgi:hypothetical protein
MRDLQVLRHYGLEWPHWYNRHKFQGWVKAALSRYAAEQHQTKYGRGAVMKELSEKDEEILRRRQLREEFNQAWLEGLPHATGSIAGGFGAWFTSQFTDDPKKITAGAKMGTAVSGTLGSWAQAKGQQDSYVPEAEVPRTARGGARYTNPAPTKVADVVRKPPVDPLSVPRGTDVTGGKAYVNWDMIEPTGPSFADVSMQLGLEAPGTTRYRSTAQAAQAARQSGLENANRPGFQTHSTAATVRQMFGVTGGQRQSAHIVPQSVYRRLRRRGFRASDGGTVSEGRAFTTLLPTRAHKAFDSHWVSQWTAAKDAGRPITAGDVYKWVSAAVNRVDPSVIPNDIKGAINDRLRTELFSELGLAESYVIVAGRPPASP